MTPSRIIPSVIQHDVECYACRGNRYVIANHSLGMLIAIMDDENGPEYKINFIKAIRTKWGLGLKAAKEVAEATLRFRENVIEAVEVQKETSIRQVPVTDIKVFDETRDLVNGAMYVEEPELADTE